MQGKDRKYVETDRRNALRLLTGSGLAMVGVASSTAAADETRSQQEDEGQTIAEGTSGYVTSDEQTPDWFTLESAGDARWNIGDFKKRQANELSPQHHLDCDGDQLDWGGTVEKWGVEFTLHLDHCAGTCNWDFQVEALGQSISSGTTEECNDKETFSGGVHPLQVDAEITVHESGSLTEPVGYWDVEISVEYYDPRSGWEDATWNFSIDNPVA